MNSSCEDICMPQPVLTTRDLLAWLEKTSTGWRDLLIKHPELLALPCDIMNVATAGQLFQHIVAVELRYMQRLADLPVSEYADIAYDTPEVIYATHDRTVAILNQLLTDETYDWNAAIDFTTRAMGPARSTRRTLLFHTLFHGIRHYAQLATLVRQHGIKPGRPMDYL